MDRMEMKKKIIEDLLAHMDDSQGKDMHELMMSKHKPSLAVEIDMEKKMTPEELKKHELSESPEHEAEEKAAVDKDDDDEMSDEEIEEMLKGLK